MRQKLKTLLFAVAWLLIWEITSRFLIQDSTIFPSLTEVVSRLVFHVSNHTRLISDLVSSLKRFTFASVISFPLSLLVAYMVSRSGTFGQFVNFFFSATYSLPKVAIYPFMLILFGIGDVSKIVLIGIGMFYLFYFNSFQGIKYLDGSSYHDIIKVFKVPTFQKIWSFYLKGTIPFVLAGLRTGLGYGLVLVVVSEMSFSTNGVGLFIWNAWDQFRLIDLYVGLAVLLLWGSVIFGICDAIEKVLNKKGLLYR
jgi:ABC-type nitrate/sulfonate/bicarbonate transport system permease component